MSEPDPDRKRREQERVKRASKEWAQYQKQLRNHPFRTKLPRLLLALIVGLAKVVVLAVPKTVDWVSERFGYSKTRLWAGILFGVALASIVTSHKSAGSGSLESPGGGFSNSGPETPGADKQTPPADVTETTMLPEYPPTMYVNEDGVKWRHPDGSHLNDAQMTALFGQHETAENVGCEAGVRHLVNRKSQPIAVLTSGPTGNPNVRDVKVDLNRITVAGKPVATHPETPLPDGRRVVAGPVIENAQIDRWNDNVEVYCDRSVMLATPSGDVRVTQKDTRHSNPIQPYLW